MASELMALIAARDAEYQTAMDAKTYAHYMEGVLPDRAAAYAAHVASMDIAPEISMWALAMRKQFGTSYVKCTHFITDWVTALLILRYGEEPDRTKSSDPHFMGWPSTFSDNDISRAMDLLKYKKFPEFFTPLVAEG